MNGIRKGWGGPFGAVLVKNGRLMASACNTVLRDKNATCHAEINAICRASQIIHSPFLTGAIAYSTTEPCPMCFSALHWARVKKIYYSTTISDVKKLGFHELSVSNRKLKQWGKSPVSIERLPNQDCRDILKIWSRLPGKKTY